MKAAGKIRHWGVSNLDRDDMAELLDAGGDGCATDQILYNLTRRGPEHELMPWLAEHRMPVMAYSPVEQGRLLGHDALAGIADRLGATPARVALAWVLRRPDVIAIPKAGSIAHIRENVGALTLALDDDTVAELDVAFPAPRGPTPLEML